MKTKGKPTLIDQQVGRNVRKRRKELKMSQEELGSHINVTFQQIQKYENGKNRISAGALLIFSIVLECSLDDFYKDISKAYLKLLHRRTYFDGYKYVVKDTYDGQIIGHFTDENHALQLANTQPSFEVIESD